MKEELTLEKVHAVAIKAVWGSLLAMLFVAGLAIALTLGVF